MKAVVIQEPGHFSVGDVPYPAPDKGEVTIRVATCCVCGTDVHILDGDFGGVTYPMIPGHEFAGTVAEVGDGVAEVKPGDRVGIAPIISCGHCYFCKDGKFGQCLSGHIIGHAKSTATVKVDGGFAEYVVMPERNVYKLDDSLTFDEAAFLPNFSTVVNAFRRARMISGEQVLIFGTGTLGNLFAQLAKVSGAPLVVVTGRSENRLQMAKQLGADVIARPEELEEKARKVAPYGFDIVVEATGSNEIVERALPFVKDTGRLLLFGIYASSKTSAINPFQIVRRNLEIIGSISALNVTHAAHDLMASGKIEVKPLISHRFPLSQWGEAIDVARDPAKCTRVLVYP